MARGGYYSFGYLALDVNKDGFRRYADSFMEKKVSSTPFIGQAQVAAIAFFTGVITEQVF